MNATEPKTISAQPGLFEPLRAGFNVAANHFFLLMFPVLLDLWLWLGLHLSMNKVLNSWIQQATKLADIPAPQVDDFIRLAQEALVKRFNLMAALRSFTVGIPSLMSSRLPVETPFGNPSLFDVDSLGFGLGYFILLSLIGLAIGTFYYLVVARAALQGHPDWRNVLRQWPWAFWQVVCLTMVWLGIAVVISLPFSCLLPVLSASGFSQLVVFFYLALMVWLFFPLILSAHGIFINREKVPASIMRSVQLTRLTLPATSGFFLLAFFFSQGLDIVWRWPEEQSWMVLIGLAGHSFVTTGLLAASFIYYREADQWVQKFLRLGVQRQYS